MIIAKRNLKQAATADDMKAVLIQSHEFGLIKKLDFYWISPNLIIDRKSKQRMLHFVCFNGDLKKAKIILDRGAKLNVKDVHGNTPLMMSIQGPKMFHPIELIKVGASHHHHHHHHPEYLSIDYNFDSTILSKIAFNR